MTRNTKLMLVVTVVVAAVAGVAIYLAERKKRLAAKATPTTATGATFYSSLGGSGGGGAATPTPTPTPSDTPTPSSTPSSTPTTPSATPSAVNHGTDLPVSGVHQLSFELQPNFNYPVTYNAGVLSATLQTTGVKAGWYKLKFKDNREVSVSSSWGDIRYNGSFFATGSGNYQQASATEIWVQLGFTAATGDHIYFMLYNPAANNVYYGSDLVVV